MHENAWQVQCAHVHMCAGEYTVCVSVCRRQCAYVHVSMYVRICSAICAHDREQHSVPVCVEIIVYNECVSCSGFCKQVLVQCS